MGRIHGWWVLTATCAACAHLPPPAVHAFSLGERTAEYRDPAAPQTALCEAEPAVLTQEVERMNLLLADYLQATSAEADGMWGEAHLQVLEQGEKSLPPVLPVYEAELQALGKCPFRVEDRGRGEEFVRQAQRRLQGTAVLLHEVRARRALSRWRRELPGRRDAAKAERCAASSKKPVVYFAAQGEDGKVAWSFCDGAQVLQEGAGAPFLAAGAPEQARKKNVYLGVVKNYPGSAVLRPPPLPSRKKAGSDDAFDLNGPIE